MSMYKCIEIFCKYSNFNFNHLVDNILLTVRCVEGFCRYSNFAGTCQTWPSDENCIFSFFKAGAANALKGETGTTITTLNTNFCVEEYNMPSDDPAW